MDLKEVETKEIKKIKKVLTDEEKKAKRREYNRRYREKNKDKIAETYKKWCENNKDRVKTYHRQYYHDNEDAKKHRIKSYYKKHKDIPEKLLNKYNLDIGYIIVLKQAIEQIKNKCPTLDINEIVKDVEEHIPKLLE